MVEKVPFTRSQYEGVKSAGVLHVERSEFNIILVINNIEYGIGLPTFGLLLTDPCVFCASVSPSCRGYNST